MGRRGSINQFSKSIVIEHVEIEIGLGQVCEKEGIKEVADLVQDAIKVNKKVVIIVIDGDVTNAIITLTNTIKAITGFGQFLDNVGHFLRRRRWRSRWPPTSRPGRAW